MDYQQFSQAIIVGGRGMLAAASSYVAGCATCLIVASRAPQTEAARLEAQAAPLDWGNRQAAIAAVSELPEADFLLSWLHDDGTWLADYLEARLVAGGRSIRVHGANSRDIAIRAQRDRPPRADIIRQTVVLGWVNVTTGARWLSDAEISDAVIEAINSPAQSLVVAGVIVGNPPGS